MSRRAQPYCRRHYLKNRADGPREYVAPSGENHPAFKGMNVGLGGAHDRIVKERGAAWNFPCAAHGCAERAAEWSLIPGRATHCSLDPRRHYSAFPRDYLPLCKSCHKILDGECDKYLPPEDQPLLALHGFDLEAHRIAFDPSSRLERTPK